MGGRSDDGIMSARSTYQEGGDVGFFKGILNALNPTTGEIVKRMQDAQKAPPLTEKLFGPSDAPLEFRTKADADAYLEANPEFMKPIKILGTGETINQKPADTGTGTTDTGTGTTGTGTGTTDKVSDEDTIKSYICLLYTSPSPRD